LYSTLQILCPLVANGIVSLTTLARAFAPAVGSKTAANLVALMMASVTGSATAKPEVKEEVLAAARSHTVSLVSLSLPVFKAYMKLGEALRTEGAGDVLVEAYPEVAKLQSSLGAIRAVVEGAASPEEEDALKDTAAALPAEARADFARGVVAEVIATAEKSAYGDEKALCDQVKRAGVLLSAVIAHGATAPGCTVAKMGALALNAVSHIYAGLEEELAPESSVLHAFKALAAPVEVTGAPVLSKDAFQLWLAGTDSSVVEPFAREATVAKVKSFIESL
jgi:hypothetical protein